MNREDIIRKAEEDEWIEITQFIKLAMLEERERSVQDFVKKWHY